MEPDNDKIIIYKSEDGQMSIEVKLENDTVWLTANQMALLFDRDEKVIRKHVNNVFAEGELLKSDNKTQKMRVVGVKQAAKSASEIRKSVQLFGEISYGVEQR